MANPMLTTLILDALDMVVGQRRPKDVIPHSDQGSQYTSLAFGSRCREAGVRPSMGGACQRLRAATPRGVTGEGSVGDAYDNAMAESFFSTLECELLSPGPLKSQADARMACFSYIEAFYNPIRLHSGIGYRSPIDYEKDYINAKILTDNSQAGQAP